MLKAKLNSNISLKDHSTDVANKSYDLAKSLNCNEEICNASRLAGMFHDIGKSISRIQSYYNGSPSSNIPHPYHNEIGWLWLQKHKDEVVELIKKFNAVPIDLNESNRKIADEYIFQIISSCVYYSHAKRLNVVENKKTIKNDINVAEKHYMLQNNDGEISSFMKDLFNVDFNKIQSLNNKEPKLIVERDVYGLDFGYVTLPKAGSNTPIFRYEKIAYANAILLLIRALLIESDHIVSSNNSEDIIYDIIEKNEMPSEWLKGDDETIKINKRRFNECFDAVKTTQENNTYSVVNMTAGGGKTSVGYHLGLRSNKKTIFLCSRKEVAKSIYDELKDLERLFGTNEGIELVYETKRQNSTKEGDCRFCVGTIDTFIGTCVNGRNMGNNIEDSSVRMFNLFNSNLVFDEYHELMDDTSLFTLFIHLMSARANIIKNDTFTLLLSATPVYINSLVFGVGNEFASYYPSKYNHCSPQHNKTYHSSCVKCVSPIYNNCFGIFNAIETSQLYFVDGKNICVNNNLLYVDKFNAINRLIQHNGKYGTNPISVTASPLIQASMNISCERLVESVSNPWNTIQRIGRCNRYGKLNDAYIEHYISEEGSPESLLHPFVKINDTMKNIIRNWRNYLNTSVGTTGKNLVLSNYYEMFMLFYRTNSTLIESHIEYCYKEGLNNLEIFFPKKVNYLEDGKKINCTSLRGCAESVMTIYGTDNNGNLRWIGSNYKNDKEIPFTVKDWELKKLLGYWRGHENVLKNILLKSRPNEFSGIKKFIKYKSGIKKLSDNKIKFLIENWEWMSKNYDLPIIVPPKACKYDFKTGRERVVIENCK
ncbi:MAG: CRISPR-associated endonuclease Cas3'' [Paludibacteraceae bacterium]|nr:CRISPR-associated endonuclease Cas3'' [Paludibacteraceae bacterium]